jgi:hypothetical protein
VFRDHGDLQLEGKRGSAGQNSRWLITQVSGLNRFIIASEFVGVHHLTQGADCGLVTCISNASLPIQLLKWTFTVFDFFTYLRLLQSLWSDIFYAGENRLLERLTIGALTLPLSTPQVWSFYIEALYQLRRKPFLSVFGC